MIRFDLFRQKWTSFGLAALLTTGMMISIPQSSFANDWVDMLKPLVKDVIVPGASMGMKKLMLREQRLHPELGKTSANSTSSSSNQNFSGNSASGSESDFFSNSTSSSSSASSANEFATPEEPISSSSTGGSAGSEAWAASHAVSATDPAPAPPPPVATP